MIAQETLQNFIGGRWEAAAASEALPVVNPATGETIAAAPLSGARDVGKAVEAATKALQTWRRVPPGDRIQPLFESHTPPSPEQTSGAFWGACHGGQRATAGYLLARGADPNWVASWDSSTPLDAARRSEALEVVEWLRQLGAVGADE